MAIKREKSQPHGLPVVMRAGSRPIPPWYAKMTSLSEP